MKFFVNDEIFMKELMNVSKIEYMDDPHFDLYQDTVACHLSAFERLCKLWKQDIRKYNDDVRIDYIICYMEKLKLIVSKILITIKKYIQNNKILRIKDHLYVLNVYKYIMEVSEYIEEKAILKKMSYDLPFAL
jgi:hypothetical protein